MLHWECYDTTEQDRFLRAYDQAMIASGIYQGRQVPVPVDSDGRSGGKGAVKYRIRTFAASAVCPSLSVTRQFCNLYQ